MTQTQLDLLRQKPGINVVHITVSKVQLFTSLFQLFQVYPTTSALTLIFNWLHTTIVTMIDLLKKNTSFIDQAIVFLVFTQVGSLELTLL